jgi:hypothetical protein
MQVLQFRPVEPVQVSRDRLSVLYAELGEAGAEDVVCRTMEELALRLSRCERLYRDRNWHELRTNTRSLVAIADPVGMHALAHAATAVAGCLDAGDEIAVAATLSRLIRIGEKSLTAIWDVADPVI